MHSEHLTNVRFSWAGFGWFISVALASAFLLVAESLGLLARSELGDAVWITIAVAAGFAIGGFLTGFRTAAAPILHGSAIALFSFVGWFLLNLTFGGMTTGATAWEPLSIRVAALGLLVQGGAAIVGCWLGYRYAPMRLR